MPTKKFNGKVYQLYKKGITLKSNANVVAIGIRKEKRLSVRVVKEASGYAIYIRSKARR